MTVGVVIASEAKQSIEPHKGSMDCFVASLPCANASHLSQAMTVATADMTSRSRGAFRPSFAAFFAPSKNQRAQGKPGALSTRSRAQECTRVTTGAPEHPAFPAQWFYGL
jgi:hypothetical protein